MSIEAERPMKPRSTRRSLAAVVLGFELVVVFLGGLTIFGLNAVQPRELGFAIAGAIILLILLAFALMRTNAGLVFGWAAQVAFLATGVLLPGLFIAGGLFSALWIYCWVVGGRMDRQRAGLINPSTGS